MSKNDSDLGLAIAACKGSTDTVTLTKAGAQALLAEIEDLMATDGVEQINWALLWQAEEDVNLFIARRYPGCQLAEKRDMVTRLYTSYVEYAKLPEEQKCVCFIAPMDATQNWLPDGYELVTDPDHILTDHDYIMHRLSTEWQLVASLNAGTMAGRRAADPCPGVRYVAKPIN